MKNSASSAHARLKCSRVGGIDVEQVDKNYWLVGRVSELIAELLPRIHLHVFQHGCPLLLVRREIGATIAAECSLITIMTRRSVLFKRKIDREVIFVQSSPMTTHQTGSGKPTRKGRGPSLDKTTATREALIAAGLAAFLENGFWGTAMSDVAQRADGREGNGLPALPG